MGPLAVIGGGALLGGASGFFGRDNEKNLTSTQTSEPWAPQGKQLKYSFKQARNLYDAGPTEYYPNQTYAGPSYETNQGLDRQFERASNGSDIFNAGKAQNLATINGDYLNANPYLNSAIDNANKGLVRSFNASVIPGLQSSFASSGRYGSDLQRQAQGDASKDLLSQAGTNASNISYGNYNDERNRQANAVANAPAYAQADYNDIANMLDVGQQREAITQQGIDEDMNRFNFEQEEPWQRLERFKGLIDGNYGGTTTSTARNPNYKSAGSALISGALGGAGMGASLLGSYGQYQQGQAAMNRYPNQA